MAAENLYESIRAVIDDHLEQDDLTTFELVGVLSMLTAEAQVAAMEAVDDDEEGEEG